MLASYGISSSKELREKEWLILKCKGLWSRNIGGCSLCMMEPLRDQEELLAEDISIRRFLWIKSAVPFASALLYGTVFATQDLVLNTVLARYSRLANRPCCSTCLAKHFYTATCEGDCILE